MAPEIRANIREAALKALSERHSVRDLVLASELADEVPSTGKRIFRFTAVPADRPQEIAYAIVVDEDGEPIDPVELSRREAVEFFRPAVATVPASVIEPNLVTINPPRDALTLAECDTLSERITVTVPPSGVVSKADVYFLSDTTFSMNFIIGAVQAGASNILSALGGLGIDFAFGVGNYKDFPNDPFAFQHQLSPTATVLDVQNAINAWSASGGSDIPEGQLFALNALAEPPGGSIGWRPDSKRIIVWFGDAPGHDPVCAAISGSSDITETSVATKLAAQQISIIAIDTGNGTLASPGLDTDPTVGANDYKPKCGDPGGSAGQATRIAAATGGVFATGIDPTNVVQTIINLVKAVVGSIKNLNLIADATVAPFVTSISPASGYGPLRGDEEHVLEFTVTFAGGVVDCTRRAQVFDGSLDVVADGAVVARKPTAITVPACRFIYSVKFVCGTQIDCGCDCAAVRPGVYATEINLHNVRCEDARVELRVIPLVVASAVAGREPNVVNARPAGRVLLPQSSATMLDCCRLGELLLGAQASAPTPLSVGLVEIVSNVELEVTAVYTANETDGHGLDVQVLTFSPRLV